MREMRQMVLALQELVKYRALMHYLVLLDLRTRYRRSVLGFLWTLLNPLLLMLVMWIVFSRFARRPADNYPLFLLSALMAWLFFQQSIERSLVSITGNQGLLQNIYIPKIVFPLTVVASNFINLVFFLFAYFVIALPTDHGIPWTVILLPFVLVMLLLLASGASLLMSSLTVFFRDFIHLSSVVLRMLFYLTPIFYTPDIFGPKAAMLFKLNPAYYPVQAIRSVLYYGSLPSPVDIALGFGTAILVFLTGLAVFTSTENRFIYYA